MCIFENEKVLIVMEFQVSSPFFVFSSISAVNMYVAITKNNKVGGKTFAMRIF